jgi:hypothetical protein
MQNNGELKKLLHELQAQGNQTGAVKALELEVIELLQKLDDATQRARKSEEKLASLEETLGDYKELNDLLEADNAKCVPRRHRVSIASPCPQRQRPRRPIDSACVAVVV